MLESPKIARTVSGPIFFVIVTDPEVAQLVYNSSPLKTETFYYILEPWLGKRIILSKESYWKRKFKEFLAHNEQVK